MSADNVLPAAAVAGKAAVENNDGTITIPVDEDGNVRVWLRHNVLGGTAGNWHPVPANHPELGRLIAINAVALPDPVTGEIMPPPAPVKRGCRSCG